MAEPCTQAFGRYLRILRERRKLSLEDVCSLSRTFPDPVTKGYLSRCENGKQRLAFAKMIALSRIYEVSAEVLVERLELDMELDRVGGPDTANMQYDALLARCRAAVDGGLYWDAYAYIRDAVHLAFEPDDSTCASELVVAQMRCATIARALGRYRYALHEFLQLRSDSRLEPSLRRLLLERLASCYENLQHLGLAEKYADEAITESVASGDETYLGFMYNTRALIASQRGNTELAASFYNKGYTLFRDQGRRVECPRMLNNLAQCYFNLRRYKAARRALEASQVLSLQVGQNRSFALSQLLLGEIDELEHRPHDAERRWREAVEAAKRLNDRVLRFKGEFLLFRRAIASEDQPAARAIGRRLRRLAPSIPSSVTELASFKAIVHSEQVTVAASQRGRRPRSNALASH